MHRQARRVSAGAAAATVRGGRAHSRHRTSLARSPTPREMPEHSALLFLCAHHRTQETYPRKNWSSMVLFNCGHPANQALTLDMVNSQTGTFLHRFSWITDDSLIGEVDYEWNFLVGWYKQYDGYPERKAKVVHYTGAGSGRTRRSHSDLAKTRRIRRRPLCRRRQRCCVAGRLRDSAGAKQLR